MKRASLLLISGFLLWAASVSAAEPVRVFHTAITRLCDTTMMLSSPDGTNGSMALEIRASVKKPSTKAGAGSNGFAVIWSYGDTTMEAWLIPSADDFDPLASKHSVDFILMRNIAYSPKSILNQRLISKGMAAGSGFNTLGVEVDACGATTVYAGEKEPIDVFTIPAPGAACSSMGISARGEIEIDLLVTENAHDRASELQTAHTSESIAGYFKSSRLLPPEGLWRFLDRDTDDRAIRLGGDYTIAIVNESPEITGYPQAFSIIYMGGARVGADSWLPGMKKGRLTTTSFQNHYNLKWIAADMTEIDAECSAQLSDDHSILTLNFPLYGSTVRFARQLSDGALPEM